MAEVADTATVIALIRSQESTVPPAERLFEDPYARLFSVAGAAAEEIAARFFTVPFFREAIRLRTRFIDDTVRAILADGLRQIVLLGAGFDCRTLRLPEIANSGAAVFEIDFAPQLAYKRTVLAAARVKLPDVMRFVACDFTADDFETKLLADLSANGFRPATRTCFIWEGVVGYLDDAAVDRTLAFVARVGGTGSRVVLNHTVGRFRPEQLRVHLAAAGFTPVEEHGCDALHRRYLPGEPPPGGELHRLAIARVA
jgi:methyltransferase (TIGR00027 family)